MAQKIGEDKNYLLTNALLFNFKTTTVVLRHPLAKAYLGEIWLWLRMKVACLGVRSIQESRNMSKKYTSPSSELFQKYYPNP